MISFLAERGVKPMTKLYTFQPVEGANEHSTHKTFLTSGEAFWGYFSFALAVIVGLFGAAAMAVGAYGVWFGFAADSPGLMVGGITVLVAIPWIWKTRI